MIDRITPAVMLGTALLAIAAVTHGAAGGTGARSAFRCAPGSELWMEGKSTVHDWQSRTGTVNVVFTRAAGGVDPAAAPAIEALVRGKGVRGVEVEIPVATLHSERKGLDKNMMKALNADQYPTIHFRMDRYTVISPASVDTLRLRISGALTVSGTRKNISFIARAWKSPRGEWVEGIEPLSMTDFGIKPPRMMLGTLKVADRIDIHYRLLLAPETRVAKL